MQLVAMEESDLAFRIRIETDPIMMSELGGANSAEQTERSHRNALKNASEGKCWYLKICTEDNDAGFIGIWESFWEEQKIYEMGWMIVPEFQGRGLATQAGREIIEKARAENRFDKISAFPGRTNIASNKICEKLGFNLIAEVEVDYQDKILQCHHWRIEL